MAPNPLEDCLLFLFALALVLVFSVFLTAVLRPPGRAAALVSLYLLSYANVVLVGEITNTFLHLNNETLWLGLHLGLAASACWIWLRFGRPSLRAPWVGPDGRWLPGGIRSSLRNWPDLWALGIGVALVFLFNALLVWVVPPNNNDSLATHMSRVAYWLQRGSFFPWPTHRTWQITYPVNMQLQMFWTVLLTGSDRIVESIQWLAAGIAVVAVFGLARLLGAARPQAIYAALMLATFPEIILESTSTQNDLVAGTLFVSMLFLFHLGMTAHHPGMLILSGLALGLALGTKQTLLFLMPGLAAAMAVWLVYKGWRNWRSLVIWSASALVAFSLLGGYMYVVNQVSYGHPMGPETAVNAQTGGQNRQSLLDNLTYNVFRLFYQAIDPTGLPDPLTGYGFKAKALVVGKLADWLKYPVEAPVAVAAGHSFVLRERYLLQEDAAWYGPLFSFLVLPALVYQFAWGVKRREPMRVGIFILALTFLFLDALLRPGWDPFQGRYFIPVVMASTACAAFTARTGRVGGVLRWMVVILALTIAATTLLNNSGKPVTGERSIWNMDRVELQTLQSFYMRAPLRMVEKYVPADATVGLINQGVYLEYPFFREDYSRRLVQIYPPEQAQNVDWLKRQGIEYILVQTAKDAKPVQLPEGLVPVTSLAEWTLYAWADR
jgi:4-amino-4-deoxy-L-arabinose transferase-like glycosyltransferase